MFIGHYAVAFAAKQAAPRASLGVLFGAAQLADLVWPILVLTGVERVRVTPSDNPFLLLGFEHYPWSHSLLALLVWALLAGGVYALVARDRTGALVVGALVISHWMLDWITHVPDLPLYPGGAGRYGLGVWRSVSTTMLVEGVMFGIGFAVYAAVTRPRDRAGGYGLWGLAAFLAMIFFMNAIGTPPPSATAVAWVSLAALLIPLFGYWVDRHREAPGGDRPASAGASVR